MDTHRHFYELIRENPEDDAPRLIYADWLDELGDPRGEFIRVQCELATLSGDRTRRAILQQREEELLEAHQDRWNASLPDFFVRNGRFERGFLTQAMVMNRFKIPLRECWERLFEHEPVLSDVELGVLEWDEISRLREIPQLRSLRLCQQRLEGWQVSCLLRSHVMRSLKSLDLSHNFLRSGVKCVAQSPTLLRLEELDVSFNRIGTRGARAIAASPFLRSLKSLNLRGNHIGHEGKRKLRDAFGPRVQL